MFNSKEISFSLNNGEIVLWLLDIKSTKLPGKYPWKNILHPDILREIKLLKIERTKQIVAKRKSIVIFLLAKYLNIEPNSITFCYNGYKKPYINPDICQDTLFFNVSHSKGYLLVGISKNIELGVDLEIIDQEKNFQNIVTRYFSPSEQEYFSLLNKAVWIDTFYSYWTIKEAITKCLGTGLSYPLHNFSIKENSNFKIVLDNITIHYSNLNYDLDKPISVGLASMKLPETISGYIQGKTGITTTYFKNQKN